MHIRINRREMGREWVNQDIGYYLPDSLGAKFVLDDTSGEFEQTIELGDSITPIILHYKRATGVIISGGYASYGIAVDKDKDTQTVTIHGTPTKAGTVRYTIKTTGNDMQATVSGKIYVNDPADIEYTQSSPQESIIYDLFGRRVKNPANGIYIINNKKVRIE